MKKTFCLLMLSLSLQGCVVAERGIVVESPPPAYVAAPGVIVEHPVSSSYVHSRTYNEVVVSSPPVIYQEPEILWWHHPHYHRYNHRR